VIDQREPLVTLLLMGLIQEQRLEFLPPLVSHQFRLDGQAGADGDGVEVIDCLGAQLDQAVTMPELLQDGAALRVGPIDLREFVLE